MLAGPMRRTKRQDRMKFGYGMMTEESCVGEEVDIGIDSIFHDEHSNSSWWRLLSASDDTYTALIL